jgi:hypothetical protein
MKQVSRAQRIREYMAKNPTAKAREIADALKLTPQYVHQVAFKMKAAKPKGTTKPRVKAAAPSVVEANAEAKPEADMVNYPPHYTTGGMETIDFIEAKRLSFHLGNVVKYVVRAEHKGNKVQDLMKADWYLKRAIVIAGTEIGGRPS